MKRLFITGKGRGRRYSFHSDSGVVYGLKEVVKSFAADRIVQFSGYQTVQDIWKNLSDEYKKQYEYEVKNIAHKKERK